MDQDERSKDKLSEQNKHKETGEEDMAVIEKELKEMQLLQNKRKLTKEEMRQALLQRSLKNNYEALKRLSQT